MTYRHSIQLQRILKDGLLAAPREDKMIIREEAVKALQDASKLLQEPSLQETLSHAISSKTDATWLDLAGAVLPVAIESVENSKVVLPASIKNKVVTDMVLPLIKDKLPWYVKPFAGKLISWFIDLIVSSLNKLFTKKWGEEIAKVEEPKAEGTI